MDMLELVQKILAIARWVESERLLDQWQVRNATCVFAVQLYDDQCLSGVFWSDARARIMYNLFSDVVIFDTTTKIDGNKLLFATFLGVNNHAHLVFLGGVLVASETEATFMWIFGSWLEAMHGYQPGCIITDVDAKIQRAASKMFPNSHHMLCKRHNLKKVMQKLSDVCLKFKSSTMIFLTAIVSLEQALNLKVI